MISSFILVPDAHRNALAAVRDLGGWKAPPIAVGPYALAHDAGPEQAAKAAATLGDRTVVVMGEIANRDAIRSLLTVYDTGALVAEDAGLFAIALDQLGEASLALFEGAYACVVADARAGTLQIFTDSTGQMTLYTTRAPWPCVTSHLKLLCLREDFAPVFAPADLVVETAGRADDFCPVINVKKVKSGASVRLSLDGASAPFEEQRLFHRFRPGVDRRLPFEDALRLVRELLGSSVQACAAGGGRVAVPLSGGLDSSLITAFAARGTPNLATISVGTELSDEFSFAEIVARHAGTRHTSLVLTHEAILRGLVDAIYHNEIYDGLSSEIQAPLFALYRRVSGEHDTLLTGYGADLLFGGILPFQAPSRAANDALWEQVYRTRWTGEFSPTGARSFGLTVKHPFWSNRLVAFCLDLDPALKVSTDEIKILLRKLAGQDGLLPREIAARKKIGIHEGSSVNRIFADAIGTTTAQYAAKTRFSYFVYRTLLQRRMKAREVEPAQMLDLYRHDAGAGR